MPSSVASLSLCLTLLFTAPLSSQAPAEPTVAPTAEHDPAVEHDPVEHDPAEPAPVAEPAPAAVETNRPRAESTHASEVTRADSRFENDACTTSVVERPELRLELPTPEMTPHVRRDLRARRLELTGWTIVGLSAVTGLGFGLAVGMHDCGDDAFLCFNGPVIGLLAGLLAAAPGVALGTLVGTIGTVRRRRAQHAGTWSLSWSGSSVRFGVMF